MTPASPEAFNQISDADAPYAITSRVNIDRVAFNDPDWWGRNTDAAVQAFLDAIS